MMPNVNFYKVGGAIRDQLLGLPVADIDWVVVGANVEYMLAKGYQPVGADFPVFIHPTTGEEYALARTERKSGKGYGGFSFYATPTVTLEEDLARRDLTINAIAQDQQGYLYDPYGGQQDLKNKVLRHVSPAFIEDPLRVLRVARFAARYACYGFVIAPETLALMRQLSLSGELKDLTAERIWKEFSRALLGANPEVFFNVLVDCYAIDELLPEVKEDISYISHALEQAGILNQSLPVRWACLLVGLANRGQQHLITCINQRFKVPNDCYDLATLAGQYLSICEQALVLPAQTLLHFLLKVDVLRRPERLSTLLQLLLIDAVVSGKVDSKIAHSYPPFVLINQLAESIATVAIEPLMAQGFKGAALGEALFAERLQKVSHIIKCYHQ